jgi:hypothetical protein
MVTGRVAMQAFGIVVDHIELFLSAEDVFTFHEVDAPIQQEKA